MSRSVWLPPTASVAQSLFQLALAVPSGVLVALCFPPFDVWWLAWVALVPFGLSVVLFDRLLEPLVGALIGGATLHLVALDWVRTCFDSSGVTGPWAFAWLAIAVAASPAWCAMALVVHLLIHRFAIRASIALAVGWMTGDLARRAIAVFFTEMDFPWLQLAATQTHFPAVVQAADIVGATGISGLIAFVNGSLCDVLASRGHQARMRRAAPALILLAPIMVSLRDSLIDYRDCEFFGGNIAVDCFTRQPLGQFIFKRDCDGHRKSPIEPKSLCSEGLNYVLNSQQ